MIQGKTKMSNNEGGNERHALYFDFFEDKIKTIRSNLDSNELPELSVRIEETCASSLFTFSKVTEDTVRKLIMDSPSKSYPLDSMSTWLLKKCADSLVLTITKIINLSLSTGVVPENFKTARVVPLLKKTGLDCNNLKNYRPVSLLMFISKLLERCCLLQVNNYLAENNLYVNAQSAYRQYHSTGNSFETTTRRQCFLFRPQYCLRYN